MRKNIIIWTTIILLCLIRESAFANSDHTEVDTQSAWQEFFPNATALGEKESSLPVWPVYQVGNLIGYIFESVDLIKIPGFSGEPINLLIGMDIEGKFVDVKLLAHNEPIFLHGLGEKPLHEFIEQYKGLNTIDSIKVGKRKSGPIVYLDGITKATASVVVVNETILLSALKVAREKLEGFEPTPTANVIEDIFTVLEWQEMLDKGYIKRIFVKNEKLQNAFSNTPAEYMTDDMAGEPDDVFTDLYFAYLNVPSVGKNLLGDIDYQHLRSELKPGEQAIAVMSNGHYSFVGDDFIPGAVPDRLTLQQKELPVEIRDMNFYDFVTVNSPHFSKFTHYKLFRIKQQTTFDPGSSWKLTLLVNRSRGQFFQTTTAEFTSEYLLPKTFFTYPEIKERTYTPPWMIIWENRVIEIIILVASLILLTGIILFQHRLTKKRRTFRWVRGSFLVFTLFFIGWYSQGQLSIVNVFTIVQSLFNGFNITDYLIDPIIFILWIYVFISLILWGRGIFCGWLCPFGALQEMLSWLAKKLNIRQIQVAQPLHTKLWLIKYVALLILVGVSVYSLNTAGVMSEFEPFKTAITLIFIRTWPFVLYAVILLGLGLFIHKFYCRYLCPLGAGLAVIGWFRRFEWLNRRKECGTPCQLCRKKCEIDAIKPSGAIDYNECIQCFECIVYYNNDDLCAPEIIAKKRAGKDKDASNIIASTQYYTP